MFSPPNTNSNDVPLFWRVTTLLFPPMVHTLQKTIGLTPLLAEALKSLTHPNDISSTSEHLLFALPCSQPFYSQII